MSDSRSIHISTNDLISVLFMAESCSIAYMYHIFNHSSVVVTAEIVTKRCYKKLNSNFKNKFVNEGKGFDWAHGVCHFLG